jgi:adenosyl cobinamide kinase/adenosyl cobinamide phosphate guanylyltransferase
VIVLVIGGARSGKSAAAEAIAAALPQPVTYVATLVDDGSDPDLSGRVRVHHARRPADWSTVEAGAELPAQALAISGTVLIDSLGPWVASHRPSEAQLAALADALVARVGSTVVVTDEVGMSVHPSSPAGREFRDELGLANAAMAAVADEVLVVVAGRVLRTEPLDAAAVASRGR